MVWKHLQAQIQCNTSMCSQTFFPSAIRLWNTLPVDVYQLPPEFQGSAEHHPADVTGNCRSTTIAPLHSFCCLASCCAPLLFLLLPLHAQYLHRGAILVDHRVKKTKTNVLLPYIFRSCISFLSHDHAQWPRPIVYFLRKDGRKVVFGNRDKYSAGICWFFVVLGNDKLQFICRMLQEYLLARAGHAVGSLLSSVCCSARPRVKCGHADVRICGFFGPENDEN